MKTAPHLWIASLAVGAATVALPAAALARDAAPPDTPPQPCTAAPPPRGMPPMPPPGAFPDGPPPMFMPPLTSLRGVELTEAQEDKLFNLIMSQAPAERTKAKEAFKALNELRHLANGEHFDSAKARQLAETHAQAMAQLALMHAELDAKIRALLTPEQRRKSDEARAKAAPRARGKNAKDKSPSKAPARRRQGAD